MDFKNERLMMSNEEARNRAKELLNENQEVLIAKYMFLEQQCKKQKEVIDKAIELTNNFAFKILTDNRTMYIRLKDLEQGKYLLEILENKEV